MSYRWLRVALLPCVISQSVTLSNPAINALIPFQGQRGIAQTPFPNSRYVQGPSV